MSYPKEVIMQANALTAKRRADAEQIQRIRHTEITAKVPDVAKYEAELAKTGLEVVRALTMGEDAEKYIKGLAKQNLHIQELIGNELEKAGYPRDYLKTPYTCSVCSDTGFVEGVACECRKAMLRELNVARLEKVSPARYCRFDNFDVSLYDSTVDPRYGFSPRERMGDLFEYCRCYADDFDESSCSLYMHGATGLGKTHLSLAIANVACAKGFNVLYYPAHNLLSLLEKEKFSGNSGETEQEVLDCDLLIIDDLGSEFSTQFTVSALYNIINTRFNLSKPVIISTNLNEEELEKRYTQRVTSRIIGYCESLLFVGRDVRQIKSEMQ
ncbi:MAG: ATP-binding protein [Clostridia bacterium]|nr:ATP-binding protein [Clostridia bacterium]